MSDRTVEWNGLVDGLPLEQSVRDRLKDAGPPSEEQFAKIRAHFEKADEAMAAAFAAPEAGQHFKL